MTVVKRLLEVANAPSPPARRSRPGRPLMPPRAGLSEAAVLDAAATIADEAGLDAVTLAAVAQRVGVRPPSLYNHVDGLEGLRRGLAALGSEEMAARLTRAAVGKSGDDACMAIAYAYRAYAKERPGLYQSTLRAPGEADTRRIAAAQTTLDVIGAALEPFGLRDDDLVHAIRGLRSVIHGFVSQELAGSFGMPQSIEASFEFSVRAYLRGLEGASQRRRT